MRRHPADDFQLHFRRLRWLAWIWAASLVAPAGAMSTGGPLPLGPPFEVVGEFATLSEDEYSDDYAYAPGFENDPRAAGDPNGNFIVVWSRDDYGISAQHFDAGGMPRSEEFSLAEEEVIAEGVDVAADSQGNFVVVWSQASGTGTYPIFAQRFTDKAKRDGNSLLASDVNVDASHPRIDMGPPGDKFAVAWIDGRTLVQAKRGGGSSFNGPTVDVNTEPFLPDRDVDTAIDGNGNWLVVWPDTGDDGIAGRVFDSSGSPLGPEFAVTTSSDWYVAPAAAGLGSGGFVVAWEQPCCARKGVTARLLNSSGAPLAEFPVGPADADEVAAAAVGSDRFVLVWTTQQGGDGTVEGQLYKNDGTPEGSSFVVDAFAYGRYLTVAGRGEGKFVVAWDGEESPEAECEGWECGLLARLYAVPEEPKEVLLEGDRLILTNKIPDDFYKSGAKLSTGDAGIVGVEPGGWNDPRCLTQPAGTIKASLRFVGQSSGHETGEIPLPCQHWRAYGDIPQRNFEYKDAKLVDGPCKKITIDEAKERLKIVCKGKKDVAEFPFDLEQGVSEDLVDVVLRLGTTSYCMSFPPFGLDGSNGKVFRGIRAAAPLACPSTTSFAGVVGTAPRGKTVVPGARSRRLGVAGGGSGL